MGCTGVQRIARSDLKPKAAIHMIPSLDTEDLRNKDSCPEVYVLGAKDDVIVNYLGEESEKNFEEQIYIIALCATIF